MVKLLAKLFIKDDSVQGQRERYGILCSCLGIALNVFLFGFKFFAGSVSGAISVTADAFNNLSDSGSSLLTMLGFRLAGKKPDPNHPFGHGRMEYLSGLAVSVLIVLMGFELLKDSVNKIIHPEPVEIKPVVFIVLAVSILVKIYMFFYNSRYGKRFDSSAMKATASDSLSDCIATSGVLLSMVISYFAKVNIDAYCGTVVSLLILYAGIKSAYETVQPLLGQAPEEELVKSIERIVLQSPMVCSMHDLVVHDYGPGRLMISLHAEVPATGNILEMHDEIDNIERRLTKELSCEAVIHMDPIQTDDKEVQALKEIAQKALCRINPDIRMHDFRAVIGETHTNLIFDVLVSHSFTLKDDELKARIEQEVKAFDQKLFTVVHVDKDYVRIAK